MVPEQTIKPPTVSASVLLQADRLRFESIHRLLRRPDTKNAIETYPKPSIGADYRYVIVSTLGSGTSATSTERDPGIPTVGPLNIDSAL
jgi:hypothetical protein